MVKLSNYILLFISLVSFLQLDAQVHGFSVKSININTSSNDEFAPAYFNEGIVYCSNEQSGSVMAIKSGEERLFNLLYAEMKDSASFRAGQEFSKELTTLLNEGPATFNMEGTLIIYARNTLIEGKLKDINDPSNKLGLFSAELVNGKWQHIKAFPYNNIEYSLGTPGLSADGLRLFFASDMPGGYGGTDIYYSDFKNNEWQKPVNLGPAINTGHNESYPFSCISGRLFYASDKPGGLGGKDIYYTWLLDESWAEPTHLDKEINSSFDDYGIVTDEAFEYGLFSSNRFGSEDLLFFKAELPQFSFCETQKENKRCFEFYDERYVDTLYLEYEWDFGDGIKKTGFKVKHCFDRGGVHNVKLTVLHKIADTIIKIPTSHRIELDDIEQPYIDAEEYWTTSVPFSFNGHKTNLPGLEKKDYYWNFGEGYSLNTVDGRRTFTTVGDTEILLGVIGENTSNGIVQKTCVSKKLVILEDMQAVAVQNNPAFSSGEQTKGKSNATDNGLEVDVYVIGNFGAADKHNIDKTFEADQWIEINTETTISQEFKRLLDNAMEILSIHNEAQLLIALHANENRSSRKNQELTEQWREQIANYFADKNHYLNRIQFEAYGDSRIQLESEKKATKEILRKAEFIYYR